MTTESACASDVVSFHFFSVSTMDGVLCCFEMKLGFVESLLTTDACGTTGDFFLSISCADTSDVTKSKTITSAKTRLMNFKI